MHTPAAALSRYGEEPKTTIAGAFPREGLFRHCQRRIEASDWDAVFLKQEKRMNRICAAILWISALYFVPFLIGSLLR